MSYLLGFNLDYEGNEAVDEFLTLSGVLRLGSGN